MQDVENFIEELNSEFKSLPGNLYYHFKSGNYFTEAEVRVYCERQLAIFYAKNKRDNDKKIKELYGLESTQRLVSDKSKKPKEKKGTISKIEFNADKGKGFSIVYRDNVEVLHNMKFGKNEKLVYFVLRDYIVHPYNCVKINDQIPSFKDLEPIVSLTERAIRDALKVLESKNVVKLVQASHRKAIYVNPQYYASGREISSETLKMFGILEIDEEKIKECMDL